MSKFYNSRLACIAVAICAFANATAGQFRLAWDAPLLNTDGSPISNLAGYRILVGTNSLTYTTIIDMGLDTQATITNLVDGRRYYFAVRAVNASQAYSTPSAEFVGDVAAAAPAPALAVSAMALSLTAALGANPPSGNLAVWNQGGGTLTYSLTSSASWLALQPASGTSTGEHDNIMLTATTASLPAGAYTAAITANSSGASNEQMTVLVTLSITKRFFRDADGDGFGNDAVSTLAYTAPTGYVSPSGDCNDANAAVNPNAAELPNGIDDNCNGLVDDGLDVPSAMLDFDGDVRTDPTVFLPLTGAWFSHGSDGTDLQTVLGAATTFPAPEDYDGDLVTDFAVYAPQSALWTVIDSRTGLTRRRAQGNSACVPVAADYDGDGQADFAVYNTNTFEWTFSLSGGGTRAPAKLATVKSVPVPADYDGDQRADLALYTPSTHRWTVSQSSDGVLKQYKLNSTTGLPAPGDYDADGKVDMAEYDYGSGVLRIRYSTTGRVIQWKSGLKNNVPIPGDYDGDGAADLAVYSPAKGLWTIDPSAGPVYTLRLGSSGWQPANAAYAIQRQLLPFKY